MEISALEIYFIMQADDIKSLLIMLSAILIPSLFFWIPLFEESGKECLPWFKRHIAACIFFLTLIAVLPETRTLAAMYVGPEILSRINLDRVEAEGNEVWELGKEALRNIGKPEQSKKEVE